jgi:hypothetical protein
MSTVTHYTGALVAQECGDCGITFGMPADFRAKRIDDHKDWYCPNGHCRHFTGKSELEKARDELARVRGWYDQEQARAAELRQRIETKERQIAARKAVATKLRKRIAAGKCPCCHTRFKDLAEHMKAKHPKWSPEHAASALAANPAP